MAARWTRKGAGRVRCPTSMCFRFLRRPSQNFFGARARGVMVERQALVREAWVRIPPCSFKEENKLICEKAWPGIEPGTTRICSKRHAVRPSSWWCFRLWSKRRSKFWDGRLKTETAMAGFDPGFPRSDSGVLTTTPRARAPVFLRRPHLAHNVFFYRCAMYQCGLNCLGVIASGRPSKTDTIFSTLCI